MPEAALTHKRSQQRRPLSLLFTTEADDGSFFMPPELAQRKNLIQHLIQHSEQLLLILADQGSGKSTLLHHIKTEAQDDWKLFNLSGHPSISEELLLKNLLNIFNVRSDGKTLATLRETLRSHIAATRYNNQLPLLLVDDAHMLPLDTLHLLLDLVMSGEKQTRLRVVLFCEPQITSVLAAPEFSQVRNTLIHTLDIPALTERQVDEYIKFRLAEGRYTKDNPFSGMTVRKLFEQSEGRIGRLNPLAQQIINEKLEEQLHIREDAQNGSKSYKMVWLVVLALLFIGLLFGLQWLKNNFFTTEPMATENLTLPEVSIPLQGSLPVQNKTAEETPEEVLALNPDLLKPTTLEENQGFSAQRLDQDVSQKIKAARLEIPNPPDTEETTNISRTPETAPAEQVQTEENQTPPSDTEAAPATPPAINNSEHSRIAGVKSAYWLSQQNPQDYSIQILGSHTLEGVSRFIRQYEVDGDMALYLTEHQNRDWYVLLYGVYSSRQAAKQALRQLPNPLRQQTKPWLRSLSSIQAAIAKRPQ